MKDKNNKTLDDFMNDSEEKPEINLVAVQQLINSIENDLEKLKNHIFDHSYKSSQAKSSYKNAAESGESSIIEGVFNGEEMVDSDGKKYQVPQNYASKSKLVPGDVLKLTIVADGSFIFKQIGPIDRKKLIGEVIEKNGKFYILVDDKKYNVLLASVTYFKAVVGDKVTIIVPKDKESNWAVIENIIGR